MSPVEDAIHAFVREHEAAEAHFLAEIVKVPSDNPPGDCDRPAEVVARLIERLGLTVERHKVPDALVKANGMISATNLIVRRRFGEGGPTIALNAHGDVVPPGAGWTRDPYGAEIVDGWMYGRGVAVSKSDIATYTFAMLALEKSGAKLNGAVELHVTYDEEAGGEIGPRLILDHGLSRPDLAIGAGFSYAVVNAHNGCLHLEVDGRRPFGARRQALHRRRRARSGERDPGRALWLARRPRGADFGGSRHWLTADDGRAHLGRDQHQRRAGPGHVPARPAHGPRGEASGGRGGAARRDRPRGDASPGRHGHGQPDPARRAADADARRAPGSPKRSAVTRAA